MNRPFEELIATTTPQFPWATAKSPPLLESVASIHIEDDGTQLRITIPYAIAAAVPETALASDATVDRTTAPESWTLIAHGASDAARYLAAQNIFSRTHNRPAVPPFDLEQYQAPTNPRVACVIVLNENDTYVRRCLLPSLLGHESGKDLEVLIVSNGSIPADRLRQTFHPIRVIESDWGSVGRAYQAGADASSAEFLAFLHDDCMASHGTWVDLVTDALIGDVGIVSQQIIKTSLANLIGRTTPDLPHPKATPMVMTRENLARFGGWDLQHFIGYEELDLALASLDVGLEVRQMDAGFIHDAGHSTILKYLINVPHLRDAFALGAIPLEIVHQLRGMAITKILATKTGKKIQQDLLLNVLQRHPSALVRLGMSDVDAAIEDLERNRAQNGSILDNWNAMVEFDRDLAHKTHERSRGSRPAT